MRLRVWSLPLFSGLTIRCFRELWCRLQMRSDPELLWLWRRPEATVPIQPLAWEPPYAEGAAQEKGKKNQGRIRQNMLAHCLKTPDVCLFILFYFIYLFIFCLFAISWAAPVAYGGSQA